MPSSLDRELQAALEGVPDRPARVGTGQGNETQPVTVSAAGITRGTPDKGSLGFLLVLLVMATGILVLVLTSFKSAAVYAKHVDEVVVGRSELAGRRLRVEGFLVHGSLERRDQPCEYRFQMERNGAKLLVHYPQCVVPDTFRDVPGVEVGVTVEGRLTSEGDFRASQIMAKCPSKYEERKAGTSPVSAGPGLL